jgi:hypothetical protein
MVAAMNIEEIAGPKPVYVLAETRIEERDSATWVSGLCPFCWERVAYRMPPAGRDVAVYCPRGLHLLRIVDLTSAGRLAVAKLH